MIFERSASSGACSESASRIGMSDSVSLRIPGCPADGRDARAAVGDAEVGQLPRRAEDVVEVHHRLAHPHEHEVVERLDAAEVQDLVEDLARGQVAAELHRPVAQNVHVSGQPDCEETQTERRPSR